MYLVQQYRRWYAYHDVPPTLRAALGRKRFCANLKTADHAAAKIAGAVCEAQWLAEIERARKPNDDAAEASFWRGRLAAAKGKPERRAIEELIVDAGAKRVGLIAWEQKDEPGFEEEREQLTRFVDLATGDVVPLGEHLDDYLALVTAKPKSVHMKRTSIKRFAADFATTADVSRPAVQHWISRLAATGAATATIRRALSEVRGYWKYLASVGAAKAEPDPFDKLTVPAGRAVKRQPFSAADVVRLLAEAGERDDGELVDLISIAMWTGARAGEIAALRVENVRLDAKVPYFIIPGGKTDAAAREVPVHKELEPVLRRLIGERSNGLVLTGLAIDKHGNISGKIAKRFGHMKQAMGFGRDVVFHSIRKTVATLLENAGVPENVAADILGHEKPTMTYGLYSGGASLKVKAKAIGKLKYAARA